FLLKRYAAKWTYYAWLIIIIGLIIPFRPEINMSLIEVNLPFASTESEAGMTTPGDDSFQSMEFKQAVDGEEQQSFFYSAEAMEQGALDVASADKDVANSDKDVASYNTNMVSTNEDVEDTNVNGEVPFYTTSLQDNGAGEATTDNSVLASNTEEQNKLITSIVGWTAIVFAIWLTGALSYLIYQLHTYRSFSRTVRRWSVLIEDVAITYVYRQLQKDMGITKNIPLKYSAIIDTPMLIGYVNPTIVLPRTNYQLNELRFVLTHELVHYKRKDMWVKALTMVATAMHWFNPLLYVMSKAISSQCEISCDEAVVKRIDQNGRREYG
uniref:M56 family metallopeptidase n=1 Tax=Longirhabdus pacifica TaxID=2305227 RepID=UPI0013E8CD71